jgi:hypothetical protein
MRKVGEGSFWPQFYRKACILKFTNLNPLRALTSYELFQIRTD